MGESKRKRDAAAAAGIDRGFDWYRGHVRSHLPKISEKAIGEGWMRQYGGDLTYGKMEDFPVLPDAISVHLLFETATLNGAVLIGDVEKAVDRWQKTGVSRQETRDMIQSGLLTNEHNHSKVAECMIYAALWLAWNSEISVIVRERLKIPCRVIYQITKRSDWGDRAYNFRLMLA